MKTSVLLWAAAVAVSLPSLTLAQTDLNRTPSRVVGQPSLNFRSANPNVVDGRSLYSPLAVAVDTSSSPNAVFVADTLNNRVLGWRSASQFENGARADLVMGQVNESSTERLGPGTPRTLGFYVPNALTVDTNGNLYVLDAGNNRILRFPRPFGNNDEFKTPDMVIGQTNFTSGGASGGNNGGISERTIAVSNNSTLGRSGFAFDPQGNLWFSDTLNNRVLRYPKSALDAGTSNPAADLVLGQADFRTNSIAPSTGNARLNKAVLNRPAGIAVDNDGRVYVADAGDRVLAFTPPYTNGKPAARIAGIWIQPANTPFTTPEYVLQGPTGVVVMNNRLIVVDTQANRIVRYLPFSQWPEETEAIPSPPAEAVLGQADFGGLRPNRQLPEPNGSTLAIPEGAYVAGPDLWVADTGNHRVLVFSSFGPTAAASRVLGQLDVNHNSPNIVEGRELWTWAGLNPNTNLADGGGVAVDRRSNPPRLYIADTYNNRVLGYTDARRVRPGDPADIVIGQNDFTRTLVNAPQGSGDVPTNSGLFRPSGLAVDTNGDLYVADSGNGRVLRFPSPFEQNVPAGERRRANLVLGQPNFDQKFTDPTRNNMSYPFGVALTVERHLVVSDAAHHRVLFFRRPAGGDFTNGMAAERVIGQPDFNTGTVSAGSNRMSSPRHIALDTDDRLYVADAGNNRILIFDRVPSAPNDPPTAFPITNVNGVQSVWVSPNTGEIWAAASKSDQAQRFPRFELLTLGIRTDYTIPVSVPLAMTQDAFGNLYIMDGLNRLGIYFNALDLQIAGNYASRPLAPGAIGIVYPRTKGSTFTSDTVAFNTLPLPKELGDTEVLLNDRPLPLYFVSPGQINYLVPFDIPESGTAELQVVKKSVGQILAAGPVALARVAPALFTSTQREEGQLAAVNVQDGSINSPSSPVSRGQFISLYGTGMGPVSGAPPEGEATSGPVPGVDQVRVFMGISFVPQENIQYFGLAPGLVGVYQINVKVPDAGSDLAPGPAVDVVVEIRSVLSNRMDTTPQKILKTTIAVQP